MSGLVIALLILNLLTGFVIGWFSCRFSNQRVRARAGGPVERNAGAILKTLAHDSKQHTLQMQSFIAGLTVAKSAAESSIEEMHRSNQLYEQKLAAHRDDLTLVTSKSDKGLIAVLRQLMTLTGDSRHLTHTLADHIDSTLSDEVKSLIAASVQQALISMSQLESKLEAARRELDQSKVLLAQATEQARTDQLTKLPNRRSFDERLSVSHERFGREQTGYAVILFDLDNFKFVNDTYGHQGGDAALAVFGRILQESVRSCDYPARMGGEEFAVLVRGADAGSAMFVAERCRGRLEGTHVRSGGAEFGFTTSAGIAVVRPGDTTERLLAKADQALYLAKMNGKNRTKLFEDNEVKLQTSQLVHQGA